MIDKLHIMVKTLSRKTITLEVGRLDTINKVNFLFWLLYCSVVTGFILVHQLGGPVGLASVGSTLATPVIYIEPIVSYDM